MTFEAQESIRIIALMVAGGVFAGAGLWLLLRPVRSGTSAKFEIFGLKFESSSAGVLVFLIGAAFLALPLVVPEKAAAPSQDGGEPQNLAVTSDVGEVALRLPPEPSVVEIEPNDKIQSANQFVQDVTVSGTVHKGNPDWFVIAMTPDHPEFIDLRLRNTGSHVRADLYNEREEPVGYSNTYGIGAEYVRAEVLDNDRFYIRISTSSSRAGYEIAVLPAVEK